MTPEVKTTQKWTLASVALTDAYTDFFLSRQAMRCTPETLTFYNFTAGKFILWLESQSINAPGEVEARHVRAYLAKLIGEGKSSWTVNDHARAVRTLLRFWYSEKYLLEPIVFAMPKVERLRLPVLSAEELRHVLSVCNVKEKAIILLLVDTGIRRQEACNLNWSDLQMTNGLLRIERGKGGKARSVVVGATTRRALLAYRRTFPAINDTSPLLISQRGGRLTGNGLRLLLLRLSAKAGIKFSAHALRRTFVILSLRAGMDVLHLQALLGHSSLEMVQHYAQMVDDDLLQSHQAHSPVDNLARLK
jgi:site-specific recombinase XerD